MNAEGGSADQPKSIGGSAGNAGAPPIREGHVLAGKYRVERVLGVGGMGIVVAAHHIELDERVAIKFLQPEMLANTEAVARFRREARAAVKIKSEHVARVSDVGTLDNGAPYMVMEYLDGSDLSAWLANKGALPLAQAVDFVLQACEAIAEAHALGIVHRDLKPSNLFVVRRPDGGLSVKVLDFGISKVAATGGSSPNAAMTRTSSLMGSPLYMSPEQVRSSRDVDTRADIWSLGVILYELVAGRCPFAADSMPQLLYQIMSEEPAPLCSGRPDVPEVIEAIILRCLAKDRGKRLESVGELAIALLPFAPKSAKRSVERISGVLRAAGFAGTAMVPPASSEPGQAESATAASWGRTASRNAPGRSRALAAAGVVVAAAGIAGAVLYAPRGPTPELVPASSSASAAASLSRGIEASRVVSASASPPAAAPSVVVSATPVTDRRERPPSPTRLVSSMSSRSTSGTLNAEPPKIARVLSPPAPLTSAIAAPRPRAANIYDERK